MLSYLLLGIPFMWWGRVLRSVLFILKKVLITRGLSRNLLMASRQRNESVGETKKLTCLFFHQEKLQIRWMTIWPFFVAVASQFMTTMIMYHRTSLQININSKVTDKNVVKFGNQS